MNILCIGGGPAGLYFGLLMKQSHPSNRVRVVERNRAFDTFGWGVVLSDQTLGNLQQADPVTAQRIGEAFNHWDDIDVFYRGQRMRSTGHGFCGIGRKHLLNILQDRCLELGVELAFETDVADDQALAEAFNADIVIASDGLNSRIRTRYAAVFQPDIDTRQCRFVWLGTRKRFDAFTFAFVQTEHGWFQAHAYRFDGDTSTFIVETPESVWQAHGIDQMTQAQAIAFCEQLFAPYLDGHALISNATHQRGSANWSRFPRVICATWVHTLDLAGRQVPIVLMGDAAHTAHFSIGSGTKLALEDAIDLASALRTEPSMAAALALYESRRSVEVLKIQNAARNSTEWFENVARYTTLEPEQFAYSLLTRSQRISHENLRLRDVTWLNHYEHWLANQVHTDRQWPSRPVPAGARAPVPAPASAAAPHMPAPLPMLLPLSVRGLTLPNRIVVSPMATYQAVDGVVQDFHLVHLGARALGGAGLVMVEMTSPSPDGRITPGCPGLWNDAQQSALERIVRFCHSQTGRPAIGLQLGHAGPKGSTRVGWEGTDQPLLHGNWPLIAPSAVAWSPANAQPQAMTQADMDRVLDEFVAATCRAADIGLDWLELHCAHGYLLSAFICPLTNRRTDAYGGDLAARCRFPLAVFSAMRAVWPAERPMSVRISAHDWAPGGNTPDDAVHMARWFKAAGCDVIDVSSGQTTPQAQPVYGRMYQTPFADRIRQEAGIRTMAVGAITDADQANSIVAAGRADLCAIARPHLADPAWTLHAAADALSRDVNWPLPYLAGRDQLYREIYKQKSTPTLTR